MNFYKKSLHQAESSRVPSKTLNCLIACFLVLLVSIGISGCSGGDVPATTTDTTDTTTTGTTNPIASSGSPHTIVLTKSKLATLEDLGGGVYRNSGTLIVTDKFGNPVVDGTKIDLGIIDSVIVEGTTGVLASSSYLSDASPKLSDGTATDFLAALISRNDTQRSIELDDWVMVTAGLDDPADKVRNVGTGVLSNLLPMQTPYIGSETGLSYVVGASLLGIYISGVDAETGALTRGVAYTKDGLAAIRVTYPANKNTIFVGCGLGTGVDTRYSPDESAARVFTVATAGGGAATMIDKDQFCFTSLAPWALTAVPETISGDESILLTLEDKGAIRLPFVGISRAVNKTTDTGVALDVTVTTGSTNTSGQFTSTITVNAGAESGDVATITYNVGDEATATVTLTIP